MQVGLVHLVLIWKGLLACILIQQVLIVQGVQVFYVYLAIRGNWTQRPFVSRNLVNLHAVVNVVLRNFVVAYVVDASIVSVQHDSTSTVVHVAEATLYLRQFGIYLHLI